jgi:hypothetical protein
MIREGVAVSAGGYNWLINMGQVANNRLKLTAPLFLAERPQLNRSVSPTLGFHESRYCATSTVAL